MLEQSLPWLIPGRAEENKPELTALEQQKHY